MDHDTSWETLSQQFHMFIKYPQYRPQPAEKKSCPGRAMGGTCREAC